MISYTKSSKRELPKTLDQLYTDHFEVSSDIADDIDKFVAPLAKDTHYIIEYPYVDKVFRDSYYSYFSSKLNNYSRNCIRVSVFSRSISLDEFFEQERYSDLLDCYQGFFVVRPTYPNPIGRTVLSPGCLKDDDFLNCTAKIPATCNGVKLVVEGFPYSSQDRETITCAETTLWAIMEYFSQRYADYSPVLPSDIISTLKNVRSERQLPSLGLKVDDLSHALKSFGFGTRIYDRDEFKGKFWSLLSCYIESGIPIILAMSNNVDFKHAILCTGREKINNQHIQQLNDTDDLSDFDAIRKKFVFIDDNLAPYQKAYLDSPASNYDKNYLDSTEITHFIVPLYPKIYLEAYEAKAFSYNFLKANGFKGVVTRILLASSRSFKHEIMQNKSINNEYKEYIASVPMPKFIWLCEITNKELLANKKCFATMILDATEPNINKYKPLLFFHISDMILIKQKGSLSSHTLSKSLTDYGVYQSNLSGF